MKACNGNLDDYGRVHCVCWNCKKECENNKNSKTHTHRWKCDKIGRNELVEMFQRQTEEMIQLTKIVPNKERGNK